MHLTHSLTSAFVLAALVSSGCAGEPKAASERADTNNAEPAAAAAPPVVEASSEVNPRLLRRFAPIEDVLPSDNHTVTDEKVALGRMLYFDKRLSKNQDLSCNSCHRLDAYGVDGKVTSVGTDGQRGSRNSPTVYHAAGNLSQFWDGRAADVEEQAKGPILNPAEMAMPNADTVVRRLESIPGYKAAFSKAFPGEAKPITYDNVGRAIGAFERKLVTPSRWDAYLKGDKTALRPEELEGLKVFTNVGCMVCHTGNLLGGNSYQRVGAVEPWPNQQDQGRFALTGDPNDKMMFKVPTLRNVAKTGPYMHDGSAATLSDAVSSMAKHQLGMELTQAEITAIVAWLGSLTGEIPKEYIAEPALPGITPGSIP